MKITEVKSFPISIERNIHFVKVETDSGIYGIGEAGCIPREFAQEGAIRHFREVLFGMDPMRIEHIWQHLYRRIYYEGGRVLTHRPRCVCTHWDQCKRSFLLVVQ